MKKILVALLALAVVGSFVFADDALPKISWSGTAYAGYQAVGDSQGQVGGDVYSSNNPSWGGEINTLDATVTGANYGGKLSLKQATDTSKGLNISNLNAWWQPIQYLKVTVGLGTGPSYTTPIEGNGLLNDGGAIDISILPIDGLVIAAEVLRPYGSDNTWQNSNVKSALAFYASYALANVATVGGGYDLQNAQYWAGLDVKAVQNLVFQLDLFGYIGNPGYVSRYTGVNYADDGVTVASYKADGVLSKLTAEQKVAYTIGAFTPSIWLQEVIISDGTDYDASDALGKGTAIAIRPRVAYNLGPDYLNFTPDAYFQYNKAPNSASKDGWQIQIDPSWTTGALSHLVYVDIFGGDSAKGASLYKNGQDKVWDVGYRVKISF